MTEDIRELYAEAGRKLDVAVAKQIMGWTKIEFGHGLLVKGVPPGSFGLAKDGDYKEVPRYSTNMDSAWEVVNRLKSEARKFPLFFKATWNWEYDQNGMEHSSATAQFDYHVVSDDEPLYEAYAEELPHAICLAALDATKFEIPEDRLGTMASEVHDVWAEWILWLFSQGAVNTGRDTFEIPGKVWKRWERLSKLPYCHLSEKERESDRQIAKRYLDLADGEWDL